jgi:hypothetical protein
VTNPPDAATYLGQSFRQENMLGTPNQSSELKTGRQRETQFIEIRAVVSNEMFARSNRTDTPIRLLPSATICSMLRKLPSPGQASSSRGPAADPCCVELIIRQESDM